MVLADVNRLITENFNSGELLYEGYKGIEEALVTPLREMKNLTEQDDDLQMVCQPLIEESAVLIHILESAIPYARYDILGCRDHAGEGWTDGKLQFDNREEALSG